MLVTRPQPVSGNAVATAIAPAVAIAAAAAGSRLAAASSSRQQQLAASRQQQAAGDVDEVLRESCFWFVFVFWAYTFVECHSLFCLFGFLGLHFC